MTSTNWRIASFGSSLLELHPPLAGDGGHRFQSHLSTFFPLSASRRPRLVLLFLLGPLLRRMKNGPSFRSDREGDPHGDLLMRTTTYNGQAAEIDLPDSRPALLAAFHRSAVFGCPPPPSALDAEIETLFWTAAVNEKLNRSSLASLPVLFQSKFRRRTLRQPLEPDDSGRHFSPLVYCHPAASAFK